MKSIRGGISFGVLATQLTLAGAAAAQEPAVMADIAPCMALSGDEARHACYDALEARVREAMARGRQPVDEPAIMERRPAQAGAPAAASEVEAFGREGESPSARVLANSAGETELHDRISGLREREPGRWLITLESGQVWYQANSKRFNLREGMAVRIYPSPFGGSFRLSREGGGGGGFIQVERVE